MTTLSLKLDGFDGFDPWDMTLEGQLECSSLHGVHPQAWSNCLRWEESFEEMSKLKMASQDITNLTLPLGEAKM